MSEASSAPRQSLIFFVQFVLAVGFWIYSPLIDFIRTDLALTAVQISLIPLVLDGAGLVVAPFGGWAVDRIAPRRAIAGPFSGFGLGLLIAGSTPSYVTILLGVSVLGLLFVMVGPLTNRLLSSAASPGRYGLAYSVKQSSVALAMACGLFTVPLLGASLGWRMTFIILGVLTLGTGAFVLPHVPRTNGRQIDPHEPQVGEFLSQVRAAWRVPEMRWLFGIGFAFQGIQYAYMTFMIPFLVDVHAFTVTGAALVLGTTQIGAVVGRPFFGWWSDGNPMRRRSRFLGAMGFGVGVTFLLIALIDAPAVLVPVVVVGGLVGFSWVGIYFACLADMWPADRMGFTTGLTLVPIKVGGMVLPLALGFGIDRVSYERAFVGFGIVLFVGFAAVLLRGNGATENSTTHRRASPARPSWKERHNE